MQIICAPHPAPSLCTLLFCLYSACCPPPTGQSACRRPRSRASGLADLLLGSVWHPHCRKQRAGWEGLVIWKCPHVLASGWNPKNHRAGLEGQGAPACLQPALASQCHGPTRWPTTPSPPPATRRHSELPGTSPKPTGADGGKPPTTYLSALPPTGPGSAAHPLTTQRAAPESSVQFSSSPSQCLRPPASGTSQSSVSLVKCTALQREGSSGMNVSVLGVKRW